MWRFGGYPGKRKFCTNLALFILKIQNFLKICQKLEKIGDFDVFKFFIKVFFIFLFIKFVVKKWLSRGTWLSLASFPLSSRNFWGVWPSSASWGVSPT